MILGIFLLLLGGRFHDVVVDLVQEKAAHAADAEHHRPLGQQVVIEATRRREAEEDLAEDVRRQHVEGTSKCWFLQ